MRGKRRICEGRDGYVRKRRIWGLAKRLCGCGKATISVTFISFGDVEDMTAQKGPVVEQNDSLVANVCAEGKHVILDVNGEHQSLVKLKPGLTHKVGKNAFCSLDPLLGTLYGSLFDVVVEKSSCRLEKRQRICETAEESWETVLEVRENNSQLNDAGETNQALSTADIGRMRAEGKTGDEIISALTANSATFASKTQYSQDKYKKKKAKKYFQCVTPIRPCARSLADYWFQKHSAKTGGLRSDTLAILLSLANISSGSRTVVVDGVGGLVAGAVIERMGGQGSVVNAYVGDKKPSQDIASTFNFPQDFIKAMPVSLAALREHLDNAGGSEGHAQESVETTADVDAQPNSADITTPVSDKQEHANETEVEPASKRLKVANGDVHIGEDEKLKAEREEWNAKKREEMQELCRKGFQSSVIACPAASPEAVLNAVMPLLAPSAPFAIFSSSAEPLAECLDSLKASKSAIAMQLQESWWREYQVLPGRTHPTMATSGTGGYILSGIKILRQ